MTDTSFETRKALEQLQNLLDQCGNADDERAFVHVKNELITTQALLAIAEKNKRDSTSR